eukprot:TRINITY_DN7581_c0_g1_i1.p1 TRINITY_DN7581_c0_g1~~TRINITY_DN7581_c0_g1_i1.p1  ORF type:complete len:271 (+),score=65.49 TRINITY_DN7581_c0_g1_i1:75-887(+)
MSSSAEVVRPSRAVIIAAGMGKRLQPFTDVMPKSLVPVAGREMMFRILDCCRSQGVDEFVIIRGYKADVMQQRKAEFGEGVRFVENADYERNNILQSLFKAEADLQGPLYISYSDIFWAPEVSKALAEASGDICLVIDTDYATVYEGRTDHPLSQGELSTLDADGFVNKVGKCSCDFSVAFGEFIGLAKFSAKGTQLLVETYKELEKEYAGTTDKPFVRAPSWSQAYLCDLLEYMIEKKGAKMTPVPIKGLWREIDTLQDKAKADAEVTW